MQRPWSVATYWLTPNDLLYFLTEPRTTIQGMALYTMGRAHLHQALIKKVAYRPDPIEALIKFPSSQMMLVCIKLT